MGRYDHRLRLLYHFLDENGLEWLSDEVRSFAVAPLHEEVPETRAATMRELIRESEKEVRPQVDMRPAIRSDLVTAPKSFEECIQYLIKRIENLASDLESAVSFASDLGISNVQLGPEARGQTSLLETVRQLREIDDAIQEMVAL